MLSTGCLFAQRMLQNLACFGAPLASRHNDMDMHMTKGRLRRGFRFEWRSRLAYVKMTPLWQQRLQL